MSEWGRMQEVLHDELDRQDVQGVDVNELIRVIVNVYDLFPGLFAALATPAPDTLAHIWTNDDKHDYEWCRACLLVRQRNGSSDAKPCKGPARVELRATPTTRHPRGNDVTETTAAGYHGEGEFDLHYQPGCPRCTEQRDRTRPEHGMSRVYAATPTPDTRLREALLSIIREAEEVTEAQHGTPHGALYAIIRRAREALTDD